jgi:hypothetical protein
MSTLSFVTHFRELSVSARNLGLQAQLQCDSLQVEVSGSDRYFILEPEFATFDPRGPREFSHRMLPQSRVFTGWRCAPKKSCEVSVDKRAFMAFCARNSVRTPRVHGHSSEVTANVIVKQVRPGIRGTLRGPFATGRVPADCLQPPGEVFLQEFVPGHMLEAWYWDGALFAVEIRNRPFVTGDGATSIRDLILCNSLNPEWIDWVAADDAVRFQGETLDGVLAAGKELAVGIRFASAVQPAAPENVLKTLTGTPVHEQLLRAGPIFFDAIPRQIRARTQFVLGAVIDSQQRLWFTDMATDLRIHPDAYDLMLRSLFGKASGPSPAAAPSDGTPARVAAVSPQ